METVKQKQTKLYRLVDRLPRERLDAAAALLASLRDDTRVSVVNGRTIVASAAFGPGKASPSPRRILLRHGARCGKG